VRACVSQCVCMCVRAFERPLCALTIEYVRILQWCGHCKTLAPIWAELDAYATKHVKNLKREFVSCVCVGECVSVCLSVSVCMYACMYYQESQA